MRGHHRRSTAHGLRWQTGVTTRLILLPALLLGCAPPTAQNENEDESWRVDVAITNRGTGSGSVGVFFSSGSVQSPCPQVLAAGQSCTPFVEQRAVPVMGVRVTAQASPGSTFAGWDCASAEGNECLLEVELSESGEAPLEVTFTLEVLFDLVAG